MTGWECLVRFPDVLAQMRGRYRSILVDEFQDVSLAQSEILDLIIAPHRNYMAISDDDQTIYEWRGADTGFILNFAQRYGATKYLISDNFRSRAAHLALANRVIEHNEHREPKRLSLTRGFGGGVHVHAEAGAEDTGVHIAELIGQAFRDGHTPVDVAVLVRLYAQTPFIEHALIERRIPYRIVGSTPFYQRPEVVTLLAHPRLSLLERQLQAGVPLTDEQVADAGGYWKQVVNRPARYVSQALSESAWRSVTLHGATLSRALLVAGAEAAERVARNLRGLAVDLKWLSDTVAETPASDLLAELDRRLGYTEYLKRSSGFPETGEARAAGVKAFTAYAREKGSTEQILAHMDHVSFNRIGRGDADEAEAVPIMTAFRAKGLQWPVVFVPDCNQGVFPFRTEEGLEEERRLFYVAITRPQERLHLHYVRGAPVSQFLKEADWEATLAAVEAVHAALEREPAEWRTQDALALAQGTSALGLERFLQAWWDAPADRARQAGQKVQRLLAAAERRGLSRPLGLADGQREFWSLFGPTGEGPEGEFPDLEGFVPSPPPASAPAARALGAGGGRPGGPPARFAVGGRVRQEEIGEGTVAAVSGPAGNPTVEVAWDTGRRSRLVARVCGLRLL